MLLRRDAHAGVSHSHDHATRFNRAGEADVAALGCVFESVVKKVGENLAHTCRVHDGFARLGEFGNDSDVLFFGDELVEFDDIFQQRGNGGFSQV